jgi:hypothetical protein
MKKTALATVAIVALGLASVAFVSLAIQNAAHAEGRAIEIVNATGYPIQRVFVDKSDSYITSNNVVKKQGRLNHGETVRVELENMDKVCAWDVKIDWVDGSPSKTWKGFDLCKISMIRLKYDTTSGKTVVETK